MARSRKRRWVLKVVVFGVVVAGVAALIAKLPPQAQSERRELAVDMQKEFRKHGLAYAVATTGEDDTVLQIKAPSMTRPFAEFLLQNPGKAESLSERGFTAVVFGNDQGASWTYDLGKRRMR